MGLLDDVFKEKVVTGLAIGIGAAMLAPKILPIVAEAVKPLAKGVIKGGILAFEKGKEAVAEFTEATEDIVAEVKAELEEEGVLGQEGLEEFVPEGEVKADA